MIIYKPVFQRRNALFQFKHARHKLQTMQCTYFLLKKTVLIESCTKSITYQFWYNYSVEQVIKDSPLNNQEISNL